MDRLRLTRADITTLQVDAIVNAANSALSGGGGVDGAIHRAAGPELARAWRGLGSCPTGEAVVTDGFDLPARWVVHAVGPVWRGGGSGEARLLESAYLSSLHRLSELRASTAAFPAISCGAYRFPLDQAARIAVDAIAAYLADHDVPEEVVVACPDPAVYAAFERALATTV